MGNLQKWPQRKDLSWKHFTIQELEFKKTGFLCDNRKQAEIWEQSIWIFLASCFRRAWWFCCLFVSRRRERAEQRLTQRADPTSLTSAWCSAPAHCCRENPHSWGPSHKWALSWLGLCLEPMQSILTLEIQLYFLRKREVAWICMSTDSPTSLLLVT